jgi:hypothetical protein
LTLPEDVLLPDESYKFRLDLTCPEPVTETSTQAARNNVSSFYEIIIKTNGPPRADENLEISPSPLNGTAMKTLFKFSTGVAKDSSFDFPLKYTFGYLANNLTVIVGRFYENTVATTQLPAVEVVTFYDVCDNNKACKRVMGPTIAVNPAIEYSNAEIEFKLSEFEASLIRKEYHKSFNVAVCFLLTKENFSGENQNYENKMLQMLKTQMNILKSGKATDFIHRQNVKEFIEMSKKLIGLLKVSDESFIEDLLSLSEGIQENSQERSKRSTFTNIHSSRIVSYDENYMRNILDLSEILLNSENTSVKNRERGKFVKKVHEFIMNLCLDKSLNSQTVRSKSVTFEMMKVFPQQLFVEKIIFPGETETRPQMVFTSSMNFATNSPLCLGKIRFIEDMFDVEGEKNPVYELLVINGENLIPSNEISEFVSVDFPGVDSINYCNILYSGKWMNCEKQKSNSTNITCKCQTNEDQGVILRFVITRDN